MSVKEKNSPCELCLSRKHSMFSDLSEEHLCSLTDNKNTISHKKGQILYYEGTRPLGVFCISSGVVKVVKTASNGKEQIIRLAQRGEYLVNRRGNLQQHSDHSARCENLFCAQGHFFEYIGRRYALPQTDYPSSLSGSRRDGR